MTEYLSPYKCTDGMKDGVPIALGYLAVSFGFGIAAVSSGLPGLAAVFMSMTNLTSAGQVAGVAVILASGSFWEIVISQLVINLRYSLMSLLVSRRLDGSVTIGQRFIISIGVTDEIFAVSTAKPHLVSFRYMLGLIAIPWVGWTTGTLLGAVAGEILPVMVRSALSVAIYGMFVAIVAPAARRSLSVLLAVALAVAISCLLKFLPLFNFIGDGFVIIIAGVAAAAIAAWRFPAEEERKGGQPL